MDDLPPPKLHVRLPSSLLPLASALLPRTVFRVVDRWFRCRNSRRAGEVAAWRVWPLLLKIPARARQYLWYLILERYSMTTCSLTSSSKFSTPAATKPKETRSVTRLKLCPNKYVGGGEGGPSVPSERMRHESPVHRPSIFSASVAATIKTCAAISKPTALLIHGPIRSSTQTLPDANIVHHPYFVSSRDIIYRTAIIVALPIEN